MSFRKNPGFSLIELILVMALIGIMTFVFLITYKSSRQTQALNVSAERLADKLREAHVFSREQKDSSGWGVVSANKSHYSLISKKDEDESIVSTLGLEKHVNFQDDFEIWFGYGTGEIDSEEMIVLFSQNGQKRNVRILKTGVVEIEP